MAEVATGRGYEYIAITDQSKGLKIAGGIDETQLRNQATEIAVVNEKLKAFGKSLRVLRSIELNLSPLGAGDMEEYPLSELNLALGCFHSSLRKKEDQPSATYRHYAIPPSIFWDTLEGGFIIFALVLALTGPKCLI